MSLLNKVKRLAIAAGFYRQARWLSRRIRPGQLRTLRADVEFYRRMLPPGALCFDVGANIGEKSEAMLRAGAARVIAFEPNPIVLAELHARCGRWKNWAAVEAALGSAAAVATLYASEHHGQSSLSSQWGGKTIATYQVPVLTLDTAIQRFGRPAYCKIDVEGWELEVLRGLSQTLPLVSMEFHLNDPGIQKTIACLQLLGRLGSGWVNATPPETLAFLLEQWVPLDMFIAGYPGELRRRLPPNSYGDVFVRSDAP